MQDECDALQSAIGTTATGNASVSDGMYLKGFHEHVSTLTDTQKAFPCLLHKWIKQPTPMLVYVTGGPGSGKTYTVISVLNLVNIPQLRMAPTARVAQRMNGSTIHSALRLDWRRGTALHCIEQKLLELDATDSDYETNCLNVSRHIIRRFKLQRSNPRIVVIDEVGMVGFHLIYCICEFFFREKVLVVLIGDPNQLQPVAAIPNVFGVKTLPAAVPVERVHLSESKRFTPEYAQTIARVRNLLMENDDLGLFELLRREYPVVEHIDKITLKKCDRALVHRNHTVKQYNEFYLKNMVEGNIVRLWQNGNNVKKYVDVKKGCRVFVTQNGVSSVSNGTCMLFEEYDSNSDKLVCLDSENKQVKVSRNEYGEFPIAVGFAGTIHRFQGDTMDDKAIVINLDGSRDMYLVYTALSRVRSMDQIIAMEL